MPKPILERNKPENNGIGKYILIRTAKLTQEEIDDFVHAEGDEDIATTMYGHSIDTGTVHPFFVLRYCDQFAEPALKAYAMAVYEFACSLREGHPRKLELMQYAKEVEAEAEIAYHQPKKLPD